MPESASSFLDVGNSSSAAAKNSAGAFLDAAPPEESSGGQADQFLGAPPAQQAAASEPQATLPSVLNNTAAGANRSLFGVLGMPGNAGAALSNLITTKALGWPATPDEDNPLTSKGMEHAFGTDKIHPQNQAERMAAAGGHVAGALPFMLLGGAGAAEALGPAVAGEAMAPTVARGALQAMQPTNAAGLANMGVGGVVSGAAGQKAAESVPEPYRPLAEFAGQMAGGMGYGALEGGIRGGLDASSKIIGDITRPLTKTGQQQMAGENILSAAKDPEALRRTLEKGVEPLVPGSNPTLAEAAGDQGVTQWQDALRGKNRGEFLQRSREQEAARNSSIEGLAPQNADSNAVGGFFTRQLNTLEGAGAAAETGARGNVQAATEKLGGFGRPDSYGATMRGGLEQSADASKKNLNALWDVLKPYNKMQINGAPIQNAVRTIMGQVDQNAGQQISASESPLYNAVGNWAQHPTFETLKNLRSEISSAQRQLRFQFGDESQPMRRVGQLKTSVDKAIDDAVTGVSQQEAQQVNQGVMPQEQTLEANLARLQQEWVASRDANSAVSALNGRISSRGAGEFGPARVQPYAAGGEETVSGVGGAAGQGARQSGNAAGDQVGTGQLQPFDAAGQQAYGAAREATVVHKSTFRNGPVGDVLAPGRGGAEFRTPDSGVAGKFFNSRDTSPESIKAFVKAAGGNHQAVQALREHAVADLRANAINPDGTIDPRRFDGWIRRHDKAIGALDETAKSTLKDEFGNVQKAQTALDDTMAARAEAVKDFKKSRAANFIGSDPVSAVERTFAGRDPVKTQKAFAEIAQKVKGDQDASDGLKRAMTDFILKRVRGKMEGDTTGIDLSGTKRFRQFIDTHRESLKTVFGGQGLNNLERVAMDMRRSAEATKGAKLPEQSNTTQDRLAGEKYGTERPSLMGWLRNAAPAMAGAAVGSVADHALTGGGAGILYSVLRQQGINTVGKLELEAALNPEFARVLMRSVPNKPPIPFQKRLAAEIIKATTPALGSGIIPKDKNEAPPK